MRAAQKFSLARAGRRVVQRGVSRLHALRRRPRLPAGLLAATALLLALSLQTAPIARGDGVLPIAEAGWTVRYLGEQRLPWRHKFGDTIVGGLSGIDYSPAEGLFYLISDDRSDNAPARFYTARLSLDHGGFYDFALQSVVFLTRPNGRPYPPKPAREVVDPEALRVDPQRNTVLWTNEGERSITWFERRLMETRLADPTVREAGSDGRFLAEFTLPAMFRMASEERGPRANLAFEGLALAGDLQSVWLSMEGPLWQDSGVASREHGALLRISRLARGAGNALLAQYAYRTDPLPARPLIPGGIAELGISEILAVSATRLLVLERSYVLGHGVTVRLYEADTEGASDIRELAALRDAAVVPMKKRLVLDFASVGLDHLDNLEGMSWGPTLANGQRTLVFVSDDNFSALQKTQLLAFEVQLPNSAKP